jgi:hypothetical protein
MGCYIILGRQGERFMNSRISGAVSACVISMAISTVSHAALIEVDLFSPGDALLTRDSTTALDWLDLTETVSLSFDEIGAGVGGWTAMGFRYATGAEVCDLFTREFFAPTPCPTATFVAEVRDGDLVSPIVAFFGSTILGLPRTNGVYDDGTPSDGLVGILQAQFIPDDNESTIGITDNLVLSSTSSFFDGHFLVRPVPVPAAVWLFGSGLLGMIGISRRKNTV